MGAKSEFEQFSVPLGHGGVDLDDSELDEDGRLSCPWHGYQFDIATGENVEKKCAALKPAPRIQVRKGTLFFLETGGATSVDTSRTLGGNDAHDA